MPKTVELRRHTANEGDVLTPEGVAAAVEVGRDLEGFYDLLISSGAQRATQSLACFLAGLGRVQPGVIVDAQFRSEREQEWFDAYQKAGAGDLESFRRVAPDLVEEEAKRFGQALRGVFERLPEGGRALVVGHSPMQEAAVFGLIGEIVKPISKGGGVMVIQDGEKYQVTEL